ncbi:serine protease HTRA1B-like [Tachypleus tridentatus]|uniref:serine protease HTRA1B-like n=1 Tax=Tachypleus tridentatus TaxID=6853 RepID=UPI003FD0F082
MNQGQIFMFSLLLVYCYFHLISGDQDDPCVALCERSNCPQMTKPCKAGVTTDQCDCCPVCARAEGEKCGGNKLMNLGKCGEGLYCDTTNNPNGIGICKTPSPPPVYKAEYLNAKQR